LYFHDATIFSYGSHFPIARRVVRRGRYGIERSFILFTTRRYSATTDGHLCAVRHAIPDGWEVHKVYDPTANWEHEHAANFEVIRKEIDELLRNARKARGAAARLFRQALERAGQGDAYAKAVGLRQRFHVDTPALRDELAAAEIVEERHKASLAKAEATREAKRRIERATENARRAAAVAAYPGEVAKWEQQLAAWQDGTLNTYPTYPEWPGCYSEQPEEVIRETDGYHGRTRLRLKGSRVQTSRGAIVPLAAVLPLLPFVRSGPDAGGVLPKDVGGYGAPKLDYEEKIITVGCHRVEFDELLRLAEKHGLTEALASMPDPILADYLEERGVAGAELAELRHPLR
jgi:hypothetical protein